MYDEASELVEVLGTRPDGDGTTIYVLEPHGEPPAMFADHQLPFDPSAWVLDHNPDFPTDSRGAILAFSAEGEAAAVDVGHYHFAWRLPGVILGALTVGVLFLLARVLFARREVGDPRRAVRPARRDVLRPEPDRDERRLHRRSSSSRRTCCSRGCGSSADAARWFWALMPAIGLLLGLALASKWVAAYAIGALGILVLVRSALGRIILIAGLVGVTGVLGWMAMAVPSDSAVTGNLLFPLIMIALTLAAVVVTVYHPIAWSDDEMRLAVGGPAVLGILIVLGAIGLGRADASVVAGPLILQPLTLGLRARRAGPARVRDVPGRRPLRPRPDGAPAAPSRPTASCCRPPPSRPRAGCGWAPASASRSCGWSCACSRSRSACTSRCTCRGR